MHSAVHFYAARTHCFVHLCKGDGRGVTWTHNNTVVLGKRHLILRTNDDNRTCYVSRFSDVLVLININCQWQTYTNNNPPTNQPPVLPPFYRSTCANQHLQLNIFINHFIKSKRSKRPFCWCPHALADGNQRFRIREKTLELSSTVLFSLSAYTVHTKKN